MFSPPTRKVTSQLNNYQSPRKRKSKSEIPKLKPKNSTFKTEVLSETLNTKDLGTFYEKISLFQDLRGNSLPKNETIFVGKKAKFDYIDHYKNLHRIESHSPRLEKSPIVNYLLKINEKHLLPAPMGMVKNKGKQNEFTIGMYAMGDNYAEAFSEGITNMNIKKLDLNDNRLTQNGAKRILERITPGSLVEFDISNNKLKKNNFTQIQSIINIRQSILKVLRLEGLQMKDENCAILCKALKKSPCILEVNLAKNELEGNRSLSKFIQRTKTLQKLDLH